MPSRGSPDAPEMPIREKKRGERDVRRKKRGNIDSKRQKV